jgi:WD40 repeat protein
MEKINEFKRHKSGVSASFSPDGKNILTASFDKTAVI